MKISATQYTQNNRINFQGNKISKLVKNLSMRDCYEKPSYSEFIALRKIYNDLWNKLLLPQNLKPRIQYKAMFANMSFCLEDYIINVEKRLAPFKMNIRNKSGYNKASLRHEIEHVKQFWDIIRLLGAENARKKFVNLGWLNYNTKPSIIKKMKEVEKTLGRISPDSIEGKNAQLYIDALEKYPNVNTYYGILSIKKLRGEWYLENKRYKGIKRVF